MPAEPRKRIDLRRLPRWLQYVIALAVVAVVAVAAKLSAGGAPPPAWITGRSSTVLGVVGLALLAIGLGSSKLPRRRG